LCFKNRDGVTELRQFIRASIPPGPLPTTAILNPFGRVTAASSSSCANAYSLMNFSTAPMDTASERALRMHALSHKRSCGHTRLQISGMLLVERESAAASRNRPFGSECEPLGNSIRERAPALHAKRIGAIDATTGLRASSGFIEQTVDLIKITDAFAGCAFRRSLARNVTPVVFHRPLGYGDFHLLQ
jgi:hypothetical protein